MIHARFPFSTPLANFLTRVNVQFAVSGEAIIAEFPSMALKRRLMSLFREYRRLSEPQYRYTVLLRSADYNRFKAFLSEKGLEARFTHGYRMVRAKFEGPRVTLPEYVLSHTASRRKDV